MPHVLIPDGFTLKKVTKLQKRAIDEKRMHYDTIALLNNPNTPLVAGAAVASFFLVNAADEIIGKLKEAGANVTEDIEEGIKNAIDEQKKKLIPDISLRGLEERLRDLNFDPRRLA